MIVLMNLQIFDISYKKAAENNIINRIEQLPHRGMIYDRRGNTLVRNKPAFQVKIILNKLYIKDILAFCKLFSIDSTYLRKQLEKPIKYPSRYSKHKPFIFIEHLSHQEYARIEDKLIAYPGIVISPYTIRDYPHTSLANVLGYVKEVNKGFLEKDTTKRYKQGDVIGVSGIEKYYEEYLRGKHGVKHVMINARHVVKGSFKNGKYDTLPQCGDALYTSIDLNLQCYAESLMQKKKGAIVAIEPESGEILTMLTSPSYNLNKLTGRGREIDSYYSELIRNPHNPLLNRAIQSVYPPGSTFKPLIALIGLKRGLFDTVGTYYSCNRGLIACHPHKNPVDLYGSIQYSCNPYYYQAIRKLFSESKNRFRNISMALLSFKKEVENLGLGKHLGIDLPFESAGFIPSPSIYDRKYGTGKWKLSNIQSIGIGQGEISISPLQLANQAVIIANGGWYILPHIIKEIGTYKKQIPQYKKIHTMDINREYFAYVARAMRSAVKSGTAFLAFIRDIDVCGKTGTAQNPHGRDHSVFMAFAPFKKPKIAVAVYIENGGYGGSLAAPIASLVIEKYLKGSISLERKWIEKYVNDKNLLESDTINYANLE